MFYPAAKGSIPFVMWSQRWLVDLLVI